MRPTSTVRAIAALSGAAALVLGVLPTAVPAAQAQTREASGSTTPASGPTASTDPSRISNPDQILAPGWQKSTDRAVSVIGDDNGLNVLTADASSAYQWRTAASLSEPGFDTPQWIGQDCVTGSGRYAAVVYAPWSAANDADAFDHGSFAAIVDLETGAVRKLPELVSLAYYSPGCGAGDTVAFAALMADSGPATTRVDLVDAASGAVRLSTSVAGQVTSPVPYGNGVAAVLGDELVSIGPGGTQTTLAKQDGIPFELHPDEQGGLAFEVPVSDDKVQIRRLAAGKSSLLGAGDLGKVQVRGAGGEVFLIGPEASRIKLGAKPVGGWDDLGGPSDATPSTQGQLDVTSVSNHVNASSLSASDRAALGQQTQESTAEADDLISISSTVTHTGKSAAFTVAPAPMQPAAGSAPSPALEQLAAPSSGAKAKSSVATPAVSTISTGYSTTNADDSSNPDDVTWDPVRGCAVARNDPAIQSFQANAAQIEWAADLAVQGDLTITRPANWEDSGMPSAWSIQGANGMFPLEPLDGGGSVPAQVLLGVLAQESNTMQTSSHEVDGQTGNFNQGGFYGNPSTSDPAPGTTWSDVDCGYGAGQVTTGMTIGYNSPIADGNTAYSVAEEQQAIATDYATNIAATLNMLIDKWNQLYTLGILANGGAPQYIQNWWFAAWAYNSGVQPADASLGNSNGCSPGPTCTDTGGSGGNWGLGWSNNPADPSYVADRAMFNDSAADTSTPQDWSYPEKVVGWALSPLVRYDYASGEWEDVYPAATLPTGVAASAAEPSTSQFCSVSLDNCEPDAATDVTGKADSAGLCTLSDFHCWMHEPVAWVACASYCATQTLAYTSSSSEPSATDIYPSDGCTTAGSGTGDTIPADAVIVDGPQAVGAACIGSTPSWTSQGTMSFHFPESATSCTSECILNQGKIDFHQAGGGLDGHMWFSHMINPPNDTGTSSIDDSMTATWTPPSSSTGWTRIEVHIPQSGATTNQANYIIDLGGSQGTRHRLVNQHQNSNEWVDLGTFDLASGADVSLSNYNTYSPATDGGDVAFDAVAFVPATQPTVNYVAIGDSYSAGDGLTPYTYDSNVTYSPSGITDFCNRSSSEAYPELLTYPGLDNTPIAQVAADGGAANFKFLACSGAQTVDMTASAVNPNNTWNTDWGSTAANSSDYGELLQVDDSGWLDPDTTLVTLTIGGNDARFSDILSGCIETLNPCTDSDYYLTRGNGTVDPQPLTTYEPEVINAEETQLEDVYTAIHQQAPNARVIVLGYPHLFPADTDVPDCLLLTDTSVQAAAAWMNTMSDDLNTSIENAISAVKQNIPSMNISFFDVRPIFTGHEVCSNDPEINGVVLTGSGAAFHPMATGDAAEASQLNGVLNP